MSDADGVRNESARGRSSESDPGSREELADRAAGLASELYAREERQRRKESLEELLGRDHSS